MLVLIKGESMNEQIISELMAIANELDGSAEELIQLATVNEPRAVELHRLALRLRRMIAAIPE